MKFVFFVLILVLIFINVYEKKENFIGIDNNQDDSKKLINHRNKKFFLIANNKNINREKLMNFLKDDKDYTYVFFNHIEPFKYLNNKDLEKIKNLNCKKILFMRENHLNSYWGVNEFKNQKVNLFDNQNSFVISTQDKNNNKLNNPFNLEMVYYQDFINYNQNNLVKNEFKLLYYLPAIGAPDLNTKLDILVSNLKYLYKNVKFNLDVSINCYEVKDENCDIIYNAVKKLNFINKIYFYKKKGMLTELFLTNPNNKFIDNYDYILFILDDVKIKNLDIFDMIALKKKYDIEILSPRVLKSTHNFMHKYNDITINNFLEIYCILLNNKDFKKFLSKHTIKNKYMWGVDLLFGYYNIKAGVNNKYYVDHILPTRSSRRDANIKMVEYLKEYTPYTNMGELFRNYKDIKYQIISYPGKKEPQTGFVTYHILKNNFNYSEVILWGFTRKKGEDPGDHIHEKNYELEYYKKNNIKNLPV